MGWQISVPFKRVSRDDTINLTYLRDARVRYPRGDGGLPFAGKVLTGEYGTHLDEV